MGESMRREDVTPVFTSLGMFIIDEIHFTDAPSVYNVIGGAGTFGAIGARLFLPSPTESQKVGWIVDMGSDFPGSVREEIERWQTGVVLRSDASRLTTRGWNQYADNEERLFKYLAPKLRITAADIIANPPLIKSKSFHLICSPNRCEELTRHIVDASNYDPRAIIIWEPVPDECKPETYGECIKVLRSPGLVSIFSPNAKEAAQFFGLAEPMTKKDIEDVVDRFVNALNDSRIEPGTNSNMCKLIVLRCGSLGCLVCYTDISNRQPYKWFPAYHNPANEDYRVIDPTGGGNSFVGGFATGYVISGGDIVEAAVYGNVAAGLVIEQIGLPILGKDQDGNEIWNGETISTRIARYRQRSELPS
ncbi:Mak32p [Sugiyamaella lignohabitans]|uniref:Mak32p n=1 Tax=Sugiyamaella lignohabitans TaxID=796027 RepID=A0A167C4D3_9ASCO|nr:Mak32p [Sugiyamaella lignohabitans]ANB11200.1 Mak32p [Sugiyamaella lignohabitans]